jgi:hypothetical protein
VVSGFLLGVGTYRYSKKNNAPIKVREWADTMGTRRYKENKL